MSFQGEIKKTNNNSKILKTENNEQNKEPPHLIKTKTYQGDSFFGKKKKMKNPEIERLKRLEKSKEILRTISKRFQNQNSLFITEYNGEVKIPFKKDNYFKNITRTKLRSDVSILQNYNVFETEDEFIQKILHKFYLHDKIKRQNEKNRKRMVLDKIYGFPQTHTLSMKKAKSKKYLPLKEYQDNILIEFARNNKTIEQGKFLDLVQNFKNLRLETESIIPLPKINIDNIKNHVLTKGTKNLKRIALKDYLFKNEGPLDEFEKENIIINKLKKQKYISHSTINKRNKNFDILPQYLKDKFSNQFKYHG